MVLIGQKVQYPVRIHLSSLYLMVSLRLQKVLFSISPRSIFCKMMNLFKIYFLANCANAFIEIPGSTPTDDGSQTKGSNIFCGSFLNTLSQATTSSVIRSKQFCNPIKEL